MTQNELSPFFTDAIYGPEHATRQIPTKLRGFLSPKREKSKFKRDFLTAAILSRPKLRAT
jgi:hypothetical protein